MAITFESIQSTAYTTSASLTITKPVNLAVGDLMIAYIQGAQEAATAPSGWTLSSNFTVASGNSQMKFYQKIADSGDVAASNFTWTFGGGQYHGGAIMRITGHNTALPAAVFATDDELATASPSYTSTVTPNTASSLLIFLLGVYKNSGTTLTASGYAIATSNPTWTEQLDQTVNTGSSCFQMSIATATRPQTTATGNASVTISGLPTDSGNIMIVVRPQVTVTVTDTVTTTDSLLKVITKIFTSTISMTDTLTKVKSRLWTNKAKPSNTWTNKLK